MFCSLFVLPEWPRSCSLLWSIATPAIFRASHITCPLLRSHPEFFIACGIRTHLCTNCSDLTKWTPSPRCDLHDLLVEKISKRFIVESWVSTMHACFCLLDFVGIFDFVVDLRLVGTLFVLRLQGIAASIGISNFFLTFSNGFLELSVIRVDKIDASQFQSTIELWFFR